VITFYLFRHGETDWNAEGRFQGHLDIPLNDRGREQARQLAVPLGSKDLQAILSSDLSRSVDTAKILAKEIGLSADRLYQDAGIREAFLGDAQGMTVDEIGSRFQILRDRGVANPPHIAIPNGVIYRIELARHLEGNSNAWRSPDL